MLPLTDVKFTSAQTVELAAQATDHVVKPQVYYSVMTHVLFLGQCRLIYITATLASCSNMRHCFHLSSSAFKMW